MLASPKDLGRWAATGSYPYGLRGEHVRRTGFAPGWSAVRISTHGSRRRLARGPQTGFWEVGIVSSPKHLKLALIERRPLRAQ